MNFMLLTKLQSKDDYEKLISNNFNYDNDLSSDYKEIRLILMQEHEKVLELFKQNNKRSSKYQKDIYFGLKLYMIFNDRYNLNERYDLVSNIDFWRYFTIKVVPEIVFERWGDNKVRFYSHPKRNYLLSLWWYIHLSWQGDYETTLKCIRGNSTDAIVALTERSGSGVTGGYHINLYREIMKQYGKILIKNRGLFFRRIMVYNTFYSETIEPDFYNGGLSGYVSMLLMKANPDI